MLKFELDLIAIGFDDHFLLLDFRLLLGLSIFVRGETLFLAVILFNIDFAIIFKVVVGEQGLDDEADVRQHADGQIFGCLFKESVAESLVNGGIYGLLVFPLEVDYIITEVHHQDVANPTHFVLKELKLIFRLLRRGNAL